MASTKAVQTFGKKKTATAVAHAKEGRGLIRINGSPINLLQPEILRLKVYEPVLVAGEENFAPMDIRVRVKGGGHTSQVYAIRQAIAKALVAYHAKYSDAYSGWSLRNSEVEVLVLADKRVIVKQLGLYLYFFYHVYFITALYAMPFYASLRRMNASHPEQTPLNIFIDAAGAPLPIYIEVSHHKNQLEEQLKSHGAAIVSNARTAQFIILDLKSPLGFEFARNHSEPSCKVLDYNWIAACIAERRLLLESDNNWGGCAIEGTGYQHNNDNQHMPPRIMRNRSWQDPVDSMSPNSTLNTALAVPAALTSQSSASILPLGAASDSLALANFGFTPFPLFSTGPSMSPLNSFNPQIMQNPNFLMALADVYKNNMNMQQMNLAAFLTAATQQSHFAPSSSNQSQAGERLPNELLLDKLSHPSPVVSSKGKQRASSSSSITSSDSRKGKRKASSPPSGDDGSLGPIFIRGEKSVVFFVQVDMNQRHELVGKIKEHGGSISNDQEIADLAILSSRSKTFSTLYHAAFKAKTPAITPSFIHDCIRKGRLLQVDPKYLVEAPKQRTTKHLSEEGADGKKPKVEKELEPETAAREPTVVKKRRVSVPESYSDLETSFSNTKPSSPAPVSPPSPPPPPESSRELKGGKYRYSLLEREYVSTYAKVLFERDHEMPLATIAQKLHEKMPHHSVASWNSTLSRQLRDVIEPARKRAGIAFRKNTYSQADSASKRPVEQPRGEEDPLEVDLQLVAQFFADGSAEDVEEDDDQRRSELWKQLHRKASVIVFVRLILGRPDREGLGSVAHPPAVDAFLRTKA
ncbi:hypothetical protein D9757_005334 [Collybiopsis confluens]|uniref:BRCT domain-containing protein n=1 Tax=Collybiopsis confluens TaxID=2823264 RepID=A0A8H5HLW1_9AGAR|nr:hypothetical protein D9757_005334 [Collybiopsis confluens]